MLATTLSGKLYAWGRGYYGCLGLGYGGFVDTPTHVTALSGKPAWLISAGEDHSVVGTEAGVYTMGDGTYGRLGHGDEENKCLPTRVRELSPLIEEEVEALTVKELKHELELRGHGTNGVKAQLVAQLRITLAAAGPPAHGPVIEVAAGYHHTLARTVDGSVFSWGSGADRVLAHGDDEDRFVPTRVDPAIFADPQLNDAQTIDGEPANE